MYWLSKWGRIAHRIEDDKSVATIRKQIDSKRIAYSVVFLLQYDTFLATLVLLQYYDTQFIYAGFISVDKNCVLQLLPFPVQVPLADYSGRRSDGIGVEGDPMERNCNGRRSDGIGVEGDQMELEWKVIRWKEMTSGKHFVLMPN